MKQENNIRLLMSQCVDTEILFVLGEGGNSLFVGFILSLCILSASIDSRGYRT